MPLYLTKRFDLIFDKKLTPEEINIGGVVASLNKVHPETQSDVGFARFRSGEFPGALLAKQITHRGLAQPQDPHPQQPLRHRGR